MKENVNGTEIHYRIDGTGNNRVLLLHGWGCDMTLMQPVADALKKEYRTLTVDLPGHGDSNKPPEPWGVAEYAACLLELLHRLSFIPCSVIAHSFGCRIATLLEAEHSDIFEKIIFTGAAGIRPMLSEEAKKRNLRYQQLKGYCEYIKKIPALGKMAARWEERLRQKYGSRDYNALDEKMRGTFVKVVNQDLSVLYERFSSPTLLIWGDADTETPLWMAHEMEKLIPDAGLVIFEGGTHFAYLEQLHRFITIVLQFLKGDE